ncbi:MAG: hypothetical protein QM831_23655 [Kofleriaceae bacterium]
MRLALLLLISCAPSQAHLDAENKTSLDHATAKATASGAPFAPTASQVPIVTTGLPATGLIGGELVIKLESGELAFAGFACLEPARCGDGCGRAATYQYAHASDGHVVIVRDRPIWVAVATKDDPSCPAGCGGGTPQARVMRDPNAPPPTMAASGLGITDLAKLEIRDNSYRMEYVDRVCTNTTPVP